MKYLIIVIFLHLTLFSQDILILNYYSKGNYRTDQIIYGIEENKSEDQNLYIEYLGLDFNDNNEYLEEIEDILKIKYKEKNFKYVIHINTENHHHFSDTFANSKSLYTEDLNEAYSNSIGLDDNTLDSFIDQILLIQPFLKKLYIEDLPWRDLIALKKKYPYVEFEYINLENSLGVALLNLLGKNDGLVLVKTPIEDQIINKLKVLNKPIYAFNLIPQDYYTVVYQEDFYLRGQELINLFKKDVNNLDFNNIILYDSLYLFNAEHLQRYRIFSKNTEERVSFFNEKDFFVLVNKETATNLFLLFLLVFSSFCLFVILKWNTLIKQLKYLRFEAEKHSEVKSRFLANMTHEIRTPLNGIIGMTEIMKGDKLDNPSRMKLKIVESSAKHLLNVVNEILDFSKIEAGKIIINRDRFSINQLLRELSDIFTSTVQQKKLNLVFFVNKDIPSGLIGDYLKLKQILTNLISNAIKFTSEGEIIVRVDVINQGEENCKLMFSVKDSGIGIAKEKFNKLFNSFTQLDSSYSRRYGGTGLGLSITKKFLLHMNSDIHFDSQVGDGTIFYFNLVLDIFRKNEVEVNQTYKQFLVYEEDQSILANEIEMLEMFDYDYIIAQEFDEFFELLEDLSEEENLFVIISEGYFIRHKKTLEEFLSQNKTLKRRMKILIEKYKNLEYFENLGLSYSFKTPLFQPDLFEFSGNQIEFEEKEEIKLNKRILVVEDNPTNAHVLLHYLDQLGISAHHAESAELALKYINETRYHMILMDIQLPEMNGFELTNIIKRNGHTMPIIAVTAHSYKGYREKCIENGMADYLSKPVIFDDLREILVKYCGTNIIDIDELKKTYGKEILIKLIGAYMKSYEQDLNQLEDAIKKNDIETIKKYAHKIKGTLLNFRANSIAEIFEIIEKEQLLKETIESLFYEGIELINIMNYQLNEVRK